MPDRPDRDALDAEAGRTPGSVHFPRFSIAVVPEVLHNPVAQGAWEAWKETK